MMSEVMLKSGMLMDALGYSIPDDQLTSVNSGAPVVRMEQVNRQEQSASLSADASIESTIQSVEQEKVGPTTKEELREIIRDFEEEIGKSEPDDDRVKQLISTIREKSTDVAANLLMLALQYGVLRAHRFSLNLTPCWIR